MYCSFLKQVWSAKTNTSHVPDFTEWTFDLINKDCQDQEEPDSCPQKWKYEHETSNVTTIVEDPTLKVECCM